MTKVTTIKYQGREYAQVKDRIKRFREDSTNGSIVTEAQYQPDGTVFVKATVVFDVADEGSKRASGSAFGKINGQKAYEKLETVAVGRALAFLGYGADGEIATSDEMEEFLAYQDEKKQAAVAQLRSCASVDDLKKCFIGLGSLMSDKDIISVKDEMKVSLTQQAPKTTKPAPKTK